jgi:hypothetical protein
MQLIPVCSHPWKNVIARAQVAMNSLISHVRERMMMLRRYTTRAPHHHHTSLSALSVCMMRMYAFWVLLCFCWHEHQLIPVTHPALLL